MEVREETGGCALAMKFLPGMYDTLHSISVAIKQNKTCNTFWQGSEEKLKLKCIPVALGRSFPLLHCLKSLERTK